ncbi:MAG: helix-turn-helix domain-containing protein [Ruminococcaceae bacterium]|nr:helix-turn-helix domain-containing protein [Oscillospiraceae bacterium]
MGEDLAFGNVPRLTMDEYDGWKSGIYVKRQIVNRVFSNHWHDHYEIEYITEGTGTHIFNGAKYPIYPGTLHLLTPTDFHELIPDGVFHGIKINYRESDVDPFILNTIVGLSTGAPVYISQEERPFFDNLFQLVAQETELYKQSPYFVSSLQKLVEIILLNIVNHFKHSSEDSADLKGDFKANNEKIQHILVYIHQNFKKSLDLKTVAEAAHYSPSYLSRIFHRTMGISFKAYITNLRMNFAANLISNTDMKITDIGYETGFSTLSNFTKEFKRIYHMSPSDYRMANKQRD